MVFLPLEFGGLRMTSGRITPSSSTNGSTELLEAWHTSRDDDDYLGQCSKCVCVCWLVGVLGVVVGASYDAA